MPNSDIITDIILLTHNAQCGAFSGGRNVFTINQFDVTKAGLKGFTPVSKLANYTDVICKSALP